MHKIHMILCGGILLFLLGSIGYNLYQKNSNSVTGDVTSKTSIQAEVLNSYEEQVDENGPVTVTIKPIDISEESWNFEVTLQTHSVDLDMEILKSIILLDAEGEEVFPDIWDGDVPGGHHRAGILSFQRIDPMPDRIRLLVKDVGEVSLREFIWPTIKE